jgi:hypothetical protein
MSDGKSEMQNEGMNRRELLRKALIAGGAVAAGSVVQTVLIPDIASAMTHTLFRAKFVRLPRTQVFNFTAPEAAGSPPIPQMSDEWGAAAAGVAADLTVVTSGTNGRGATIQLLGANKFIIDTPFVDNPLVAFQYNNPPGAPVRQGANAVANSTSLVLPPPGGPSAFITTVWVVYGTA